MFKRNKLSYAIATAVALGTAVPASAAIEEVVVTATKRSASAQTIPVTIQAIGEQALEDLGVANFKDYIRNLAGVVSGGRGPGRNEIFIRGVSAGKGGFKIAGAIGTEPNVALYLDEAPITLAGRNIDPYMTDMQRVEVLPGPQGTLFGASSQAGTVRLITNKPQHNDFDAGFDASYSSTKGGGNSNSVEGFLNFPLIDDKLSARIAIFNAKEGGYIDNIEGSKQIALTNPGLYVVPDFRETVYNAQFARDDFNEATYAGYRASLKYSPNDEWEVLLSHFDQELDREGVWDYAPDLGDFNSQSFAPDFSNDEYSMTSWTVTGRVADLEMVYTGSYLDRSVDEIADYSGYADAGPFIPYYICSYPGYATCGAPNFFLDQEYFVERTTHELRFATSEDNRWQAIFGVFNDDTETVERGDWNYPATIGQGFAPNNPIPGATNSNPNTRAPGVAFFNDFTRTKKETSFFGEFSYDITDKLTGTVGLRRYDIELALGGSSNFGNRGVDRDSGRNVDAILGDASPAEFSDTIGKLNLQYQVNDNVMVYGTMSEGFRAGGFNRNGGASLVAGVGPFVPDFFGSDELNNLEFGWKTNLLDDKLRFNGAAYFIEWDGIQIQTLDFDVSNLAFISNAADAEIKGLEIDSIYRPNDNFTLFANVSFNDSELTRVPPNVVGLAPVGSSLALAPELQYVIRGRYDWDTANGRAYGQVSYQYTDDVISSINAGALFEQPSYTTIDASIGYARDNWSTTLFIENVTDELAVLFISNEDDILKNTPNRPRTIGVRFSYDFE
ncbi:MAG: TonB-dependent receptor [Arenicella sp.]|jgi:iron complex outermembrane receptor protein|nr:TonB-dependent receptor [Arenicella sp.]